MNSLFFLSAPLVLGIFLGNLYFQGLWMTVQRLPTAQNPMLLTLGSLFGRLAIAIAGFGLVIAISKDNIIWHLLICVGAFMLVGKRMTAEIVKEP